MIYEVKVIYENEEDVTYRCEDTPIFGDWVKIYINEKEQVCIPRDNIFQVFVTQVVE